MTDTFTDLDLLEEICKYHPTVRDRDGGITIKKFQEKNNIGERKARELLDGLLKRGVLCRERCRCPKDGITRWVYFRNEKK